MVAWLKYGLLLTLGLSWGWAQAALVPVPALTSPVMDTANMLSTAEQQSLSAQLEAFAKANGSQIAVLTVATIEPETSFDYAVRVMADWQLGRKGVDDGVLLLLVRDERKSHIAVGRGLEGAIPDVYTKRILMDTLAPYLQEGHVYDGLMVATQQLQKLVLNEPLPEIQQEHSGPGLETAMMLVFFLWAFAGRTIKAIFGKTLGSLLSGGLGFGIALLIGLSLGFSVLIGLAVLGLSILVSPAILSSGGGGGFGGGGLGGGGFGGGGGGFSGGGGRFGGGGSSGSW